MIEDFTYDFNNYFKHFNVVNDPIRDILLRHYISLHQFSEIFDVYIEDVMSVFEKLIDKNEYVSFNPNKNELTFILNNVNNDIIDNIKFILHCLSYEIDEIILQDNNILILKTRNYGNNNDRREIKDFSERNSL